jgi:hypothetical protein
MGRHDVRALRRVRPRPPSLRLARAEDARGAVELTGHVIGVVVDLPGRARERVMGDVRAQHPWLDAGRFSNPSPDRAKLCRE